MRAAPSRAVSGRSSAARVVPVALLALASACAHGPGKIAYTPAELRAELARRAPELPAADVVVPFEIGADAAQIAHRLARRVPDEHERVRALLAALFDPDAFGMRYATSITACARDALEGHEGNCLAIASVFIGLARAAGLDACFMDASYRVHEVRLEADGTTVNTGHITAVVRIDGRDVGLDFEHRGPFASYRVIDDLEALAHFYNNRGFERLDGALSHGGTADWEEAARDFRRATWVKKDFARAWNNLGLAAARLGHSAEAIADYRTAIAADGGLAAPYNNLGDLLLRLDRAEEARAPLERAARIAPDAPHVLYNLALARLRTGDRAGARDAVARALGRRSPWPEAQRLLAQVE